MKDFMLGLYEKSMPNNLTWHDKLLIAKDAGYNFLEISIDETDEKLKRLDYCKNQRFTIVKDIYKIGMPVGTMCLSAQRRYPLGSKDEATRIRSMEIIKKAILLACDLGVRIIQIAGYDVYYEESTGNTKLLFLENLYRSVEFAAKYGVILAFETMETEFMNTVEKAMAYVKHVNSPYLQIYPDSGNITNASLLYKCDIAEDIKKGKGHLVALHLKESMPGKYREVEYGKGHVDFPLVIKNAWEQGVRKFVTEFWYTGSEKWKMDLNMNRAFFARFFSIS